ncbi:MAG: THUMP-like domain-containing protein [Planctomycetaceae bacterium]
MFPADFHSDENPTALLSLLQASPELFAAIAAEQGTEFQIQSRLRERFPAELVRMALEVTELRRRAFGKFTLAEQMWFTRQGLEQATPELVALHKAQRFAAAGENDPVFDLCCGIGGDAVALAIVRDVVAVDADEAQTWRTRENVRLYQPSHTVKTRVADVTTLALDGQLVHIDPDRRAHGQRVIRLEQYAPPLEWLQTLTQRARGGAIKVSPASNFGGKFPEAEVELISLDGECKEATIWFGELRRESPWRATVLPSGATIAGHPLDAMTDVREIGRYLYDPDPAVVRAGLADLLARDLGLWRLDAAEEYLSSDELVRTPFATPFEVLETTPNNATSIRKSVKSHGWGQVEIKCRHVKIDADAERRRLPLTGTDPGVLFFARLRDKTRGVLAQRIASDESR